MRRDAVLAAVAAAVLAVAGCSVPPSSSGSEREDCDREDLRKFERDCGYWRSDGTFVTWYWAPGTAPAGWVPVLPPGGSWTRPSGKPVKTSAQARPRTTPTGGARTGARSTPTPRARTGGSGSRSGGSGSRSGSGRR